MKGSPGYVVHIRILTSLPCPSPSYADFNEGPLDVDEHFRRSLKNVPGCEELLKEAAAKQEEKQVSKKATKKTKENKVKDFPHFDHSAIMPTPESVDDHFARALGADWAKLSKLKDWM